MKKAKTIILFLPLGVVLGLLAWFGQTGPDPAAPPPRPPADPARVLRIGLVPEHDVFALRKSYQELARYLSLKLQQPVEVATLHSYEAVLADFHEKQIHAAFLGSLVATLAMDRFDARVLVKPELPDGSSSYRGVIFVRQDSPIQSLEQLSGRPVAMLRNTLAGSLFPIAEFSRRSLLQGVEPPHFLWLGTHDEVISAVVSGQVEVGAAKDLRLAAFQKNHPQFAVRRLGTSPSVPNNVLLVRADLAASLGAALKPILLDMDKDPAGRRALEALGVARYVPCEVREYEAVYDMIEQVGAAWSLVGMAGQPPRRPLKEARR